MCGADKFGNVFITRLPEEVSGQVGFQKDSYLSCFNHFGTQLKYIHLFDICTFGIFSLL